MRYAAEKITLRDGRELTLRNPELSDAQVLIDYIQQTALETPYLLNEPEEQNFTEEAEEEFIRDNVEGDGRLMITAFEGDRAVANCHIHAHNKMRTKHRCDLGIAILKEYWSSGLGTALMERLIKAAEVWGLHQVELEVIAGNERALGLYKKMGFMEYGRRPRDLRYKDGTFADAICMVKLLK